MIKKLKNVNLIIVKSQLFLDDLDTDKMFVSNKVSSNEENYKYTIGYKDDDYKMKPSCIMLSKRVHMSNVMLVKLNWYIF